MSDGKRIYNTLFICSGNSARSIMAECILDRVGRGRFRGHSGGSFPKGEIDRDTIDLLRQLNYDTAGLRSKSWDEFAAAGAPKMDFVITVCDRAAGEACPMWPGQPLTAHWGFADPAAFEGSDTERRAFFATIYGQIERRLSIFVSLPIASLDRLRLAQELRRLGRETPAQPD